MAKEKKGCLFGWLFPSENDEPNDNGGQPVTQPVTGHKALLVGINKYAMSGADLNGCVNDVNNLWEKLTTKYGFDPDNVRMLTDERATQANILQRLGWLVDNAKAGELLIFQYSGHGCFSGDTRISLLDGTERTLEELTKEFHDRKFWVYSCAEDGKIVPGLAHSPRVTKYSNTVRIKVDNGEEISCTSDHLFMLRDGTYKEAAKLVAGDSLMPLYRKTSNRQEGERLDGYELCYVPSLSYRNELRKSGIFEESGCYYYTHRLVAYEQGELEKGYKGVLHHCDFNKANNTPENLKLLTWTKHAKIHSHSEERKKKDAERMAEWNRNGFRERVKNDKEFRKRLGIASSRARKKDWQNPKYRQKVVQALKASFVDKNSDLRVLALHENRSKSHTKAARRKAVASFKKTAVDENSRFYLVSHSEERRLQLVEANKKANHTRWHVRRNKFDSNCKFCIEEKRTVKNHKIVEVVEESEVIPVYDITVEKYHNFALTAGVFVHNSQVRDRNGDELKDSLDEILCPHDLDWDNPLSDDILADHFKRVPEGAFLTFVCDACHSGTMDRDLKPQSNDSHPNKERFLAPPTDIIARSRGRDMKVNKLGWRSLNRGENDVSYTNQRHMLISGCRDDQTSADAFIDGKYQGAMTAMLLRALNTHPDASWVRIHEEMLKYLSQGGFSQVPQLSGPKDRLDAKPFGG